MKIMELLGTSKTFNFYNLLVELAEIPFSNINNEEGTMSLIVIAYLGSEGRGFLNISKLGCFIEDEIYQDMFEEVIGIESVDAEFHILVKGDDNLDPNKPCLGYLIIKHVF